jgi:hypothetical protein
LCYCSFIDRHDGSLIHYTTTYATNPLSNNKRLGQESHLWLHSHWLHCSGATITARIRKYTARHGSPFHNFTTIFPGKVSKNTRHGQDFPAYYAKVKIRVLGGVVIGSADNWRRSQQHCSARLASAQHNNNFHWKSYPEKALRSSIVTSDDDRRRRQWQGLAFILHG